MPSDQAKNKAVFHSLWQDDSLEIQGFHPNTNNMPFNEANSTCSHRYWPPMCKHHKFFSAALILRAEADTCTCPRLLGRASLILKLLELQKCNHSCYFVFWRTMSKSVSRNGFKNYLSSSIIVGLWHKLHWGAVHLNSLCLLITRAGISEWIKFSDCHNGLMFSPVQLSLRTPTHPSHTSQTHLYFYTWEDLLSITSPLPQHCGCALEKAFNPKPAARVELLSGQRGSLWL